MLTHAIDESEEGFIDQVEVGIVGLVVQLKEAVVSVIKADEDFINQVKDRVLDSSEDRFDDSLKDTIDSVELGAGR